MKRRTRSGVFVRNSNTSNLRVEGIHLGGEELGNRSGAGQARLASVSFATIMTRTRSTRLSRTLTATQALSLSIHLTICLHLMTLMIAM
nr:hypothetical protein [Cressdnaviricota sp.]